MATADQPSGDEIPPRLTMAAFWRDFTDEVFSLDRGLPWTFWQLLVRPGWLIRRYVEARDPRITRPVRYYLVGFVLVALVFRATAPVAQLERLVRSGLGSEAGGTAVWMVLEHMALVVLVTFVPAIACGLRAAYRVHGPTFAEMWVFAVFSVGQMLIYWALASAVMHGYSPSRDLLAVLFVVFPPVYLMATCLGYFPQPGAGRAFRALLAAAAGAALIYAFAGAILVGAYQLGKHWPALFTG